MREGCYPLDAYSGAAEVKLAELEAAWNAQAHPMNQWPELGLDEIVAFAQEQALLRAAAIFDGALAYNWVCADGYSNGNDVAEELRCMAMACSMVEAETW